MTAKRHTKSVPHNHNNTARVEKQRSTVMLPQDLWERLRIAAIKARCSVSRIVEEAAIIRVAELERDQTDAAQ